MIGFQGGLLVLAVTLGVYFRTLHPSVAGGDSGELMCVAHELATPHPPGYPTFAMLTHAAERILTTLFPDMSIGYAQNAFNGGLSAIAATLLYTATYLLGGGVGGGIVAASLFAFAPNVWTYAIVTEVFPLNNLFMCGLMVQVALYWRHLQRKSSDAERLPLIYSSALLCGLSCTNQHTSIIFVIPITLWVFATTPSVVTTPKRLLFASICFFAGMLPYLYLPVSVTLWPSPNAWGNPSTLDGFMTHFFRKEYGTFSLASKESTYRVWAFGKTWRYHVKDIFDQIGPSVVLALVALIGLVEEDIKLVCRSLGKGTKQAKDTKGGKTKMPKGNKNRPVPTSEESEPKTNRIAKVSLFSGLNILLLTWFVYNNFFNYLSNLPIEKPLFYGVQQRFWIQPLIIVCIFAGVGFNNVMGLIKEKLGSKEKMTVAWQGVSLLAAIMIATSQLWLNFAKQDESDNFYVRDFGKMMLEPLPKNAILLTQGDIMINSARYVQVTENVRPDVTILDQELMTFDWYNAVVKKRFPHLDIPGVAYFPNRPKHYDIATFLDRNRKKDTQRVFLAYAWKEGDYSHQRKYTIRQFGITQEVVTKAEEQAFQKALSKSSAGAAFKKSVQPYAEELLKLPVHSIPHPPNGRYPDHSWEVVISNDLQQYLTVNGFRALSLAQEMPAAAFQASEGVLFEDHAAVTANFTEQLAMDNKLPIGYRLLLLARAMMGHALEQEEDEVPSKQLPTYVRRNLGVALQALQGYHPQSKALMKEALDVFTQYYHDAKRRGEFTSAAEQAPIEQAIEHYQRSLAS